MKERTSTALRILSRSDLQAAIVSLSPFVWKGREKTLLFPCLTICFWISTMELQLVNKLTGIWIASATHVISCSTASRMGGPGGGVPSPFIPLSRDWHIPAQASPSSTKPASLITESCVYQSTIDKHGQGRNRLLLWRGEH